MSLIAEAKELMRRGRVPEAEAAYRRVLETSPDHVEALNVLALAALREGRLYEALDFLKRAVKTDPSDAMTQHHLGRTLQAAGDVTAALSAHATAVQLQPQFLVGRLYWAAAFEQTGQMDRAVVQYSRALEDAQRTGRWLTPESTPTALRYLVEHAVLTVREQRNLAFAAMFEPLVSRFGAGELTRIAHALRIYLKQEPAVPSDPRQRPTFLFMPGLPAAPYSDRSLFHWAVDLESETTNIQTELHQLLPNAKGSEKVFTTEELEQANLRSTHLAPSWTGYYFYRHGTRREDNCASCPKTAQALQSLPLSRVRGHGPEVLFSVFAPGTHLLPHRGVTNTRLVAHLPLMIPEDCALNVGGEIHHWREGETVVFDDTYEHEAWNHSDKTRVVLIFDIWNPYLTQVEQLALADLIDVIGDFRETVDNA